MREHQFSRILHGQGVPAMLDAEGQEKLMSSLKKLLDNIDKKEPFPKVKKEVRHIIDQYTGSDGNDVKTKLLRRDWDTHWRRAGAVASGWFPRLSPDDPEKPKADALFGVLTAMTKLVMEATTPYLQDMGTAELRSAIAVHLSLNGIPVRSTPAPPMSDTEEWVFELIPCLPKGITGKQIIAALGKRGRTIEQSTLTRHIIPKLRQHGVKNRRGVGYYRT